MTPDEHSVPSAGPVLLCFDGSRDAANAVARAGTLLQERSAVVVTVWEPVAVWEPFDPGPFSALATTLGAKALGLDDVVSEIAAEQLERGVELARTAGFDAQGRLVRGKPWRAICDLADELDAEVIVLGARGLSRVQSALLGSVSGAVTVHAGRAVMVVTHGPWAEGTED